MPDKMMELLKQGDNHAYELAKAHLDADGQRHRQWLGLVRFLVVMFTVAFLLLLVFAYATGETALVVEIMKVVVPFFIGAGAGYGIRGTAKN